LRKLWIMAVSFLNILLVATPMWAGSEVTVLQKKDNGKEIQVKSGAIIELSLQEQGGTGYTWEFDRLDGKYFEVVKTETRPLAEKARVGGPVFKIWRLKAKETGESNLSLDYFRPWEGRAKAAEHYQVKVIIQ